MFTDVRDVDPDQALRPAGPRVRHAAAAWAWLVRRCRAVARRWQQMNERHRTARALRELDVRTLKDLGLYGCEIASLAAEVAGDVPPSREIATRQAARQSGASRGTGRACHDRRRRSASEPAHRLPTQEANP